MKTLLSDFIEEINRSKKSGLLSIPVKGANKLLKLFFREGEVYYVACGDAKGWGCMAQVTGSEFNDYFFMPDVSLNVQDGNLPSLSDIILYFKSAVAAAETAPGSQTVDSRPSGGKIFPLSVVHDKLKLALTRQIGPAGAKVLNRIVEQQWRPSSPPGKEDFFQLIEFLKNEIENQNDRNTFLEEARDIFS
jgi:hypothetical protein